MWWVALWGRFYVIGRADKAAILVVGSALVWLVAKRRGGDGGGRWFAVIGRAEEGRGLAWRQRVGGGGGKVHPSLHAF